jgi:hypothetical protein
MSHLNLLDFIRKQLHLILRFIIKLEKLWKMIEKTLRRSKQESSTCEANIYSTLPFAPNHLPQNKCRITVHLLLLKLLLINVNADTIHSLYY